MPDRFPTARFRDPSLRIVLDKVEHRLDALEGRISNILTQELGQRSPPSITTSVLSTAEPSFTFGTVAGLGTSGQTVRADATVALFNTTVPSNVSLSAGATGAAGKAARIDHVHRLLMGPGSGLNADLLDGLDSLAFLKADGSVIGTGTQTFSHATPLNLSAEDPIITFGVTTVGQNLLTFRQNTSGGTAAVRFELDSLVGFGFVMSGTAVAFTGDSGQDMEFHAQGGGDLTFVTSTTGVTTLSSAQPIVLGGTNRTLRAASGVTLDITADFSDVFKISANDGGSVTTGDFTFSLGVLSPAVLAFGNATGALKSDNLKIQSIAGQLLLSGVGEINVNEDGNDVDFRVESTNDTHFIFMDAGADAGAGRLGIGTSGPDTFVHIDGAIHVAGVATFDTHAVFGDNDQIQLGTGTDALIYYDNTNLVINPKSVGSGVIRLPNAAEGITFGVTGSTSVLTLKSAITATSTSSIFRLTTSQSVATPQLDITLDTDGILQSYTIAASIGNIVVDSNIQMGDTRNLIFSTGTGSKFGTATTQKMGWWNATPVVQSTGWSVSNVTTDKSFDANSTTLDEIADVLGTLIDQLKTYGHLGA